MSRDRVYADSKPDLVDFQFDEEVARVFPDMIRRSVPGYDNIIAVTGLIARAYAQENTRIYDLGSSLGASMASIWRTEDLPEVEYVCVDYSGDMLARCRENLGALYPQAPIEFLEADVTEFAPDNASVIVLNFVLQFLDPERRDEIIQRLAAGLVPGGVIILSEKVERAGTVQDSIHLEFKRANGYSDLEISQKRSALEKVMILDTVEAHISRLQTAGLKDCQQWFQCLGFRSFVAFKP